MADDQEAKIEIKVSSGPFQVSGVKSARYAGKPLKIEGGDLFLCRCGESSNPPFCDGTHSKIAFDGKNELGERKPLKVWEGPQVSTSFNPNTCTHVFYCKPLAELREKQEAGDQVAAAEIARVVRICPSGALNYELKEGAPDFEEPEMEVDMDIQEGGEIRIQRPFNIDVELNEAQPRDRAALCRCGRSKNKPFCNGSHVGKKDFV